jgi:hypothetical protein
VKNIEFAIYRKPTETGIIIPNNSCCSHKHKMLSINYLGNGLNMYPTSNEAKEKELNILKDTLHRNKYNMNKITKAKGYHRSTAPETEMGHVHVQQKRNKKNYNIIQGHPNKNSIQKAKHNTKHSETTPTKRQIQ